MLSRFPPPHDLSSNRSGAWQNARSPGVWRRHRVRQAFGRCVTTSDCADLAIVASEGDPFKRPVWRHAVYCDQKAASCDGYYQEFKWPATDGAETRPVPAWLARFKRDTLMSSGLLTYRRGLAAKVFRVRMAGATGDWDWIGWRVVSEVTSNGWPKIGCKETKAESSCLQSANEWLQV